MSALSTPSALRDRRLRLAAAWAALALLGACAADTPGVERVAACLPGLVSACDCSGGLRGIRVCEASGSEGECECPEGSEPEPPPQQRDDAGEPGPSPREDASVGEPVPDAGDPPMQVKPLAGGIRIRELAIYQAVKISLVQAGEPVVARNAPVVVGKPALLRVFLEPQSGFSTRELEVELSLVSGQSPPDTLTQRYRPAGASSDPALESTVNFELPGTAITGDLRYSVALREVGDAATQGTREPDARFPRDEGALAELVAREAGPVRVMLVPYRYQADGSGRLPVMDQEQLDLLKNQLYAFYPTQEILFEMHEPVDYTASVGPNTGWQQWLDYNCSLREDEEDDPKVLWYGLMAPRESMRAYGGGTVGISYVPGPAANNGRCSTGLGFRGDISAMTITHELGHALGLPHAPCGVSGGPFPYADAKLGVWGYSLREHALRDPDENYDVMSYCDPYFISDFNYQNLFERIRYLNLQFSRLPGAGSGAQTFVRIVQESDGRRFVTGRSRPRLVPGGEKEERTLTFYDAQGARVGQATGYFFESSEAGGGRWLVPDRGAHSVDLGDGARVRLP